MSVKAAKAEEEKSPVKTDFSPIFKKQIEDLGEINKSDTFKDFLKKEEITFVVYLGPDPKSGLLRFVTTSNDGFIKWNEFDVTNNKYSCKKSLFVCQSGISVAC